MRSFLDKGYGWPLMVIALLLSSVLMMGLVVWAARSDGGAQVVDDYYEQAVRFDSLAAIRGAAERRGWTAALQAVRDADRLTGRLTIMDSTGAPVSIQSAEVHLSRPQYAESIAELTAAPGSAEPDLTFEADGITPGLWDIRVLVRDEEGPIQFEWRRQF